MKPVTQELLRKLFDYNPETGELSRLVTRGSRGPKGAVVGCLNVHGYLVTRLNGKLYQNQRLIWMWVHGHWPLGVMDHINHVTTDNRLANLRDVPQAINAQNRAGPQKDNQCGYLGVIRRGNSFRARVKLNRKMIYVGTYATPEEAHAAYVAKKREVHIGCTM